jgi:flagellar biosynthesis/type III secretory pathway protein FliH
LSRVLRQPLVGAERLTVAVPDPIAIDPVVRSRVEEATATAYERGFADGMAAGRREAHGEVEQIALLLRGAADDAAERLDAARRERAREVLELAFAIAEAVIGREPHDGGVALLGRVQEALEHLDDEPLRVHVHPDDEPTISQGLGGAHAVTVVADAQLAPGEARIRGPWARAEVTFAGALEIVREVLGG